MAADSEPGTFGERLLEGARQAARHAQGDREIMGASEVTRRPITVRDIEFRHPGAFSATRIKRVRTALGVSQAVFGQLLNVSVSTVRSWEQGKRVPDGPSLRLLEVAERDPDVLLRLGTVNSGHP